MQTLRALLMGCLAAACISPSFATDLPNAVRAVKRGDTYVSPSLRERFHQREHSPETIAKELSPCEMEVLRLYGLAQLTVTQIAERLHRSIKTVSAQKRSGMKKLGILHDSAIGEYLEKLGFR